LISFKMPFEKRKSFFACPISSSKGRALFQILNLLLEIISIVQLQPDTQSCLSLMTMLRRGITAKLEFAGSRTDMTLEVNMLAIPVKLQLSR
jgi:hypothetical protein